MSKAKDQKKKKLLIFTNLRLVTQVKGEMKQSFLDGRIRTISSFLARLWAIIESDLFFGERNTSKLLSGEKIVEGLVLGEINTQICGLSSPYMTCLKTKTLQRKFQEYIEFLKVLLISQLFSIVKYIFTNHIVEAFMYLKFFQRTVNEYFHRHTEQSVSCLFYLLPGLLNLE